MISQWVLVEGYPSGVWVGPAEHRRKWGVPVGGAFHPMLADLARLVAGLDAHSPILEFGRQGGRLRTVDVVHAAVTQPDGTTKLQRLEASEELRIGPFPHGVGYVAEATTARVPVTVAAPDFPDPLVAHCLPGPHADLGYSDLVSRPWHFSRQLDRIGLRLQEALEPHSVDMASEPMVVGAVQLPPDGRPVILGPDGPTTGGYPVIGVVASFDLEVIAQAIPGRPIRFLATPGTHALDLRAGLEADRRARLRRVQLGLEMARGSTS